MVTAEKDSMKILLAYEWCEVGGVEAFMVSLAEVVRERGHQCELFFFEHGPMEQRLPADFVAHYGDLAECMKLVRSRGFDIVHANSSDWRLGISAVRSAGARLVITAHGMVVPGWNSTNCDAFVSCSGWQAEEQKAFTDIPIHAVLNGVDTDKFKPAADAPPTSPPIVAWVGRGIDMTHKRIDRLAAIAPALHRAGLRLWLADPYGPEEVEKVAPEAARTLREIAGFWGAVPKEGLPAFFQEVAASGGCVLSTSVREGLPMALVEAQACGCPVIGPDVRGVNECVDPAQGGLLYQSGMEPGQLANLVIDTLRDTQRMRWRRETCARYAREEFSLERMARDYIRIYHETLDNSERKSAPVGIRARLWLAPLLDWKDYVERRWTAGCRQYETSRKLAEQGEWRLASAAVRLSLVTCPTLYARPARLAHLLRTLLRPGALTDGSQAAK